MNKIGNIFLGAILGFGLGIIVIIPLAYAIAHSGGLIMLFPIFSMILGGVLGHFNLGGSPILKKIGRISTVIVLILFLLIIYFLFVHPKVSTYRVVSHVTKIQPDSFNYIPILYGEKTIGVQIQARFRMNPNIESLKESYDTSGGLPSVSFRGYEYSTESELYEEGDSFVFSGRALLEGIHQNERGNMYCTSESNEYFLSLYGEGTLTGNLLYRSIAGACYRGGECFTRYEIPNTEMIIDVDSSVFVDLPKCDN